MASTSIYFAIATPPLPLVIDDDETNTDACTAVDAAVAGDILSAGDDFCVWRWNASVEPVSKIVELESGITVVRWLPGSGRKKGGGASDTSRDAFVVACANGTFCFVSAQSGRIEKSVDAHTGAITSLCWGPEATTIVTSGEDGAVKVWSQSGVQRSTLVSTGKCIYALVWGPDSQDYGGECVVFASGAELTVKPLNPVCASSSCGRRTAARSCASTTAACLTSLSPAVKTAPTAFGTLTGGIYSPPSSVCTP